MSFYFAPVKEPVQGIQDRKDSKNSKDSSGSAEKFFRCCFLQGQPVRLAEKTKAL